MGDTSLVFNILANDKASSTIARTAGTVRTAGATSQAAGIAAQVGMRVAEASAIAWGIAVVGTLMPAVLALPGVVGAAVGAIALWKVALFGVGDAWKAMGAQAASGGQSAYDKAKAISSAQWEVFASTHGVKDAQRTAEAAQLSLNAAYAIAAERLETLDRDLTRAKLSQEGAEMAVSDARKALSEARHWGSLDDIKHADLAFRESLATLDEAKDHTERLSAEQQKQAALGVDGSVEVKDALKQQEQAQWALTEANHKLADSQRSLAEAQRGVSAGATAVNQAMAKLSPNARELVLTLHSLAPAWVEVRKAAQDAAWAGVSGDIRKLSSAYLPVLHDRLIDLGGAWNHAARQALGMAQTPQMLHDVDTILRNTSSTLDTIGSALSPILSAFTGIGAVGSSALPVIAGWVHVLAVDFAGWVSHARESGQLKQWLDAGIGALHSLWDIAGNVFSIVISILHAGADGGSGAGFLIWLDSATGKLAAFFASAKGQSEVKDVLSRLRDIFGSVAAILPTVAGHASEFSDTLQIAAPILHFVAQHTNELAAALPWLAAGYTAAKLAQAASHIGFVISLPIKISVMLATRALAKANWELAAALRAQTVSSELSTVATVEGAVAESGGTVARERSIVVMIAQNTWGFIVATATKAWAIAQWLLNVAMDANPVGAIIMAIVALIVIIVLIATKTTWFQDLWRMTWNLIKEGAEAVGHWFMHDFVGFFVEGYHWIVDKFDEAGKWLRQKWDALVAFIWGIPGQIRSAANGMWDGIKDAFKSAINWLIDAWNGLHFRIPAIDIPMIGRVFDGMDLRVPSIPKLAAGGVIPAIPGGRLALLGEGGESEIVSPESKLQAAVDRAFARGGGNNGPVNVRISFDGAMSALAKALIPALRVEVLGQHGGDVQVAMGG